MPPIEGLSHRGHEMTPLLAGLSSLLHIAFEDVFEGVVTLQLQCKSARYCEEQYFCKKKVDLNYSLQYLQK